MNKLEIEALMARVHEDIRELRTAVLDHEKSISYRAGYDLLKRTNGLKEQFLRIEHLVKGLIKATGLK